MAAFDDPADSDALLLDDVTTAPSTVLELGSHPLTYSAVPSENPIQRIGGYDFEPQINDGSSSRDREIRNEPSPNSRFNHRNLSLAERLLPTTLLTRFGFARNSPEIDHLLFEQEEDSDSYPPQPHLPRPVRPPSFPPPPTGRTGRVFGGGQGNDGVFANLSAKPDTIHNNGPAGDYVGGEDGLGGDKDEVLPVSPFLFHFSF